MTEPRSIAMEQGNESTHQFRTESLRPWVTHEIAETREISPIRTNRARALTVALRSQAENRDIC
jgi:hypothetical protein